MHTRAEFCGSSSPTRDALRGACPRRCGQHHVVMSLLSAGFCLSNRGWGARGTRASPSLRNTPATSTSGWPALVGGQDAVRAGRQARSRPSWRFLAAVERVRVTAAAGPLLQPGTRRPPRCGTPGFAQATGARTGFQTVPRRRQEPPAGPPGGMWPTGAPPASRGILEQSPASDHLGRDGPFLYTTATREGSRHR